MRYFTPLRYPGGKSKLSGFVGMILKENDLLDGHYIEPFAGGAGVALELLLTEQVRHVHLNDLNYPLYCFWDAVFHDFDRFKAKLRRCIVSVAAWQRHRAILNAPYEYDPLEVGFAFFFLNRANRSGIISGGVIGGFGQEGDWKIDARFNKEGLSKRLEILHEYRERVTLYNLNAATFVKDVIPKMPAKSLVYLDPPYYEKGQRLYDNYYAHEDHELIRNLVVKSIKHPWIVSYDNVAPIKALYSEFETYVYGLKYSAGKYYEGAEAIFFSPGLRIPSLDALKQSLYKKTG